MRPSNPIRCDRAQCDPMPAHPLRSDAIRSDPIRSVSPTHPLPHPPMYWSDPPKIKSPLLSITGPLTSANVSRQLDASSRPNGHSTSCTSKSLRTGAPGCDPTAYKPTNRSCPAQEPFPSPKNAKPPVELADTWVNPVNVWLFCVPGISSPVELITLRGPCGRG